MQIDIYDNPLNLGALLFELFSLNHGRLKDHALNVIVAFFHDICLKRHKRFDYNAVVGFLTEQGITTISDRGLELRHSRLNPRNVELSFDIFNLLAHLMDTKHEEQRREAIADLIQELLEK